MPYAIRILVRTNSCKALITVCNTHMGSGNPETTVYYCTSYKKLTFYACRTSTGTGMLGATVRACHRYGTGVASAILSD